MCRLGRKFTRVVGRSAASIAELALQCAVFIPKKMKAKVLSRTNRSCRTAFAAAIIVLPYPVAVRADAIDFISRLLGSEMPQQFLMTLHDPRAKLFALYQGRFMLPVVNPSGEMPGDIYRSPLGPLEPLRPSCLPNLVEKAGRANLIGSHLVQKAELTGDLRIGVADAERAEVGPRLRFANTGDISFSDVTFLETGEAEVRKSFEVTKRLADCMPFLPVLDFQPRPGEEEIAGILLGTVYYAVQTARWNVTADTVDRVEGTSKDLEHLLETASERLIELKSPVKINFSSPTQPKTESYRTVSLTSMTRAPIAYKPLFISLLHFNQITATIVKNKIGILESAYIREAGRELSKTAIRAAVQKEAGVEIPNLKDITEQMGTGPFEPYDETSSDQRAYFAAVDTLLALSLELTD
jgi:hypothetical protein